MSKKKKDISEAVTLESMDENIVVADTEAEGEPSVSEEKEEKKKICLQKNHSPTPILFRFFPFFITK